MLRFMHLFLFLITCFMLSACVTVNHDSLPQCSTPQKKEFVLSPSVARVIASALGSEEPSEISELLEECADTLNGYDRATAYEVRGINYARLGDEAEAKNDFRRALELNALPAQREKKLREYIEDISRLENDCFGITHCNKPRDIVRRIEPNFPKECLAKMNALEFIQLSYDVNPSGVPTNIRTIDMTNECFLDASIAALEKWRYSPSLENGTPVWRRSLETSFSFARE